MLVKLNGIKMTGACFHEIFTERTIFKFVHISATGNLTMLNAFELKSSTEYIITSKVSLKEGGRGALYLVTNDH